MKMSIKTILLGVASLTLLSTALHAEPFIPREPSMVLDRFPARRLDPDERELGNLRRELQDNPQDLAKAVAVARLLIERGRTESDPRYLGYAHAALQPWWSLPNSPIEVLVLRAAIRQAMHDFALALADLDRTLKVAPNHAQAWVMKAVILQVCGDYEGARRACLPLLRVASELVAVTCASNLASLTGSASNGYALLAATLLRAPNASVAEKVWATTVLGEIAERLGRTAEAERHFRAALALGQRDVYLIGAYADFLLSERRRTEAAELLANETRVDALMLRLALAERGRNPEGSKWRMLARDLEARFVAARLRGDVAHRREEAVYRLKLADDPTGALDLARENWTVQKEPADARILLEASHAARDAAAATPVLNWLERNRIEDTRLVKLAGLIRAAAVN